VRIRALKVVRSTSSIGAVDFVGAVQAVVFSIAVPGFGEAVVVVALEFALVASGHGSSATARGLLVFAVSTVGFSVADPGPRNALVASHSPIRRTGELVVATSPSAAVVSGALIAVVSAVVFHVANERSIDALAVVALEHVGALTLRIGIIAARTALVPSVVAVVVSVALPRFRNAASSRTSYM